MSCFGGGLSYVDEKVGVGISGVFGVGGGERKVVGVGDGLWGK